MEIKNLPISEYNSFASSLNQNHYLHSESWSKFRSNFGWGYDFIGFYKNDTLVGAANLRFKKVPKINYFFYYIPRGFITDYSNFEQLQEISKTLGKYLKSKKAFMYKIDPDIKRHTIDVHKNIITEEENNYQLIEDLSKIGYKHQGYYDYNQGIQPRYTFRIYLEGKSGKDILGSFESSNKYAIKQAEKRGVKIQKGSQKDLDRFMKLMESTKEKLAKDSEFLYRDKKYFEKMYEYYDENSLDLFFAILDPKEYLKISEDKLNELNDEKGRINLQLTEDISGAKKTKLNNKIKEIDKQAASLEAAVIQAKELAKKYPDGLDLGACMFIKDGTKSWYSYSARNYDYNKIKAVEYILYNVMVEYANERYQWLDLFGVGGDISKESPTYGLYAFKRAFGGEYIEWIGEFDYIINKPIYQLYKTMTSKSSHEQRGIKAVINKIILRK